MRKHTPKHHLGITGTMSEQQADRTGNKLANAALIVAFSVAVSGVGMTIAALIYAIRG